MEDKPRIKRIDRIGSTAEIPNTRTVVEVKSQRWIADRFYRLMGRGAFFWENPEEGVGAAITRGANYFDLKETAARIKCVDEAPKENIRTARKLEDLGERAEAAGHRETACGYYYRASLFFITAAWGIFDSENEELIWLSQKIKDAFDKVIRFAPYPMERVEIPFGGQSIPGILTLTPHRKKAPTILLVPGMGQHKENTVNHLQNPYVLRGMNTLAIDGPGQGECLMRKLWVDDANYAKAGKAAIDYLTKRTEVDADRIGAHGCSMGTYWAPLIAMEDLRVKSLSCHSSCQYDKDHIFNETSPNFRMRFMWMAGNLSDGEFDKLSAKMTLEGMEHRIRCPHLIFHGEFDHLTSTEEVYKYFNGLGSEIKEFRIYENEYHSVSRFWDEIGNYGADWHRDRLNGLAPAEKRRVVLIDWNQGEHAVDEEKIARGFSFFADPFPKK